MDAIEIVFCSIYEIFREYRIYDAEIKKEEVQKQPLSNNIQKIINIYIPTHIDVGEDVRMMGLISFIIHF